MKPKITFPTRAFFKYSFSLCILLAVWMIFTGLTTVFLTKNHDQDKNSFSQHESVLEDKKSNLVVVVVDFNGSINSLMPWTKLFSAKMILNINVKVIVTAEFSTGNLFFQMDLFNKKQFRP